MVLGFLVTQAPDYYFQCTMMNSTETFIKIRRKKIKNKKQLYFSNIRFGRKAPCTYQADWDVIVNRVDMLIIQKKKRKNTSSAWFQLTTQSIGNEAAGKSCWKELPLWSSPQRDGQRPSGCWSNKWVCKCVRVWGHSHWQGRSSRWVRQLIWLQKISSLA